MHGPTDDATPPRLTRTFAMLCVVALLLRIAVAFVPAAAHADEIWQYLEPAHYLATGRWVEAWEYRAGIRSWLLPDILAAPMVLGHWLAPGTGLPVLLPRLLCAVGSLSVVWSFYRFGGAISRRHALVAGFVAATWSEIFYYGPRTLSEPVALAFFLPAAVLLLLPARTEDRRRIILAGVLLGLTVAMRLQMTPIVATLALLGGARDWRRWGWLIAGGLLALAVSAAADVAAGGTPLRWMVENFRINLIEHKSDHFGVEPWYYYIFQTAQNWGGGTLVIVPLALYGARRYPALLILAVVHFAAHSLIPHKEMRFILPSQTLFVLLATIGSCDVLDRIVRGPWSKRLTAGTLAGWFALSFVAAFSGTSRWLWDLQRTGLIAMRDAGEQADACGLGLIDTDIPGPATYSFYDRDTPIYTFISGGAATDAQRWRGAFNVAIAPLASAPTLGAAYRLLSCAPARPGSPPQFCVYHRSGGCPIAAPDRFEINHMMAATGH